MDPFIREGPRAQVVRHGAQGHEGDDTTQARHSCEGDSYDTGRPLLRRGFIRHRPAIPAKGIHTTQARHSCEGDSYDTGPPLLRRGFIRHRPAIPAKGIHTTQARHSCEGDSYDTGPPFLRRGFIRHRPAIPVKREHCCAWRKAASEDRKPDPDLNMGGRHLPYISSRSGGPARPTAQH
jgi:hypothetical protein